MAQLYAIVSDDSYAMGFQTFGQYRDALLKNIAISLTQPEPMMKPDPLPMAATAYDPEHPYPVALRNLSALQRILFAGVVVQLDKLTTYTATAHGGMKPDPKGPWVLKLEVMGQSRTTHNDDIAVAQFSSKMHYRMEQARKAGARGWNDPSSCSPMTLAGLLIKNAYEGDFVSVANYAMMLDQRGGDQQVLADAIDANAKKLATAVLDEQRAILFPQWDQVNTYDKADAFAQALIAQGWHNDDVNCVHKLRELLRTFLWANAGGVKA